MPFEPWAALNYKLPRFDLAGLGSKTWTNADLEGKITMVYLWASWCGPCRPHLAGIQAIYDATKDRSDIQLVTLSIEEDPDKLVAFMHDKKYTFQVMIGEAYAKQLLPRITLGQEWIVDKTGPSGCNIFPLSPIARRPRWMRPSANSCEWPYVEHCYTCAGTAHIASK